MSDIIEEIEQMVDQKVASPDLSEVVMGLRDVITTTHSFKDDSVAFCIKM